MKIAAFFYEQMTALDAIGPLEILSRLPGAKVFHVARSRGPIETDSGLRVVANFSMSDVPSADLLLIPGGGNATTLSQYPDVLEWIRNIHLTSTWTTSVCTGSLILGAAGILTGLRATTHWAALDRLKRYRAIPIEERVVEDGKVLTAAGVSAGIDMALILSQKIAGDTFAQSIQLGIEYDPAPPFNAGSPAKADPVIRQALYARMSARFES